LVLVVVVVVEGKEEEASYSAGGDYHQPALKAWY